MNEQIQEFLLKLKAENILGQGITAFQFNDEIDVFSRLSDRKYFFFKIKNLKIKILENEYSIYNFEEIKALINNTHKSNKAILEYVNLEKLVSYETLFLLDYRESIFSYSGDEYSEFRSADNSFIKGHQIDDYKESMHYYFLGLILGINCTEGIVVALDSIAKKCAEFNHHNIAINLFNKLIDWKIDKNRTVYLLISESYSKLNNFEKSLEYINKYLDPNQPNLKSFTRPYFMRAELNIKFDNKKDAIRDLEFVILNTSKDYGLSANDIINNSANWQYYNKFGEVKYLTNAKNLLASLK